MNGRLCVVQSLPRMTAELCFTASVDSVKSETLKSLTGTVQVLKRN